MAAEHEPAAPVAERLAAQLLSGAPAKTVPGVAERLLAVQAQDPRGFRLAIRARTRGLTAADVDAALSEDRSVVVTWLNRGTLHLVTAADYWWLHPLTAPPLLTGNARRLAQEGVPPPDAERAVAVIERSLSAEGPLTRAQLGQRIAAAGVRTQGQALIHLLALASLRGIMVRGPMAGRDHAYVLVTDWLGERPAPVDGDRALACLATRYLAGHGPAADRDLARWAGLPLRDARRGLAAISGALADAGGGLVRLAAGPGRAAEESGLLAPRLLGAFDPVLLGWTSREPIVGRYGPMIASNGMIRSFALAGGRAVATWTMPGGKVSLAPFSEISETDLAALAEDAADVERFLATGGWIGGAAAALG